MAYLAIGLAANVATASPVLVPDAAGGVSAAGGAADGAADGSRDRVVKRGLRSKKSVIRDFYVTAELVRPRDSLTTLRDCTFFFVSYGMKPTFTQLAHTAAQGCHFHGQAFFRAQQSCCKLSLRRPLSSSDSFGPAIVS